MQKYLIDENLPYYFKPWNNKNYLHVNDMNDLNSDNEIWEYAIENNLIIITKDNDYRIRLLSSTIFTKIIHIKFGNKNIKDFHRIIEKFWKKLENEIEEFSIINLYEDKYEIYI